VSFRARLTQTCTIEVPSTGAVTPWRQDAITYDPANALENVPTFTYPETAFRRTNDQHSVTEDRLFFDFTPDVPITERCRIQFSGHVYNIDDVSIVGGGHHLLVKARKVQII
jgi:hypothetical protein